MKLKYICDWCSKEFERQECLTKGKKYVFCSRQCLWDFSNKTKNPEGYASLKDLTSASRHMSQLNRELNPIRMTPKTREKLRKARLGAGAGKTYTKRYGRHEHRVVAESILGRPLAPGEVVHHEDGNKRNNDPRNIFVFRSQSEHAAYHAKLRQFIKDLKQIELEEGGDAR